MDDRQSLTLTPQSRYQPQQLPLGRPAADSQVRNISQGVQGLPLILRLSLVDAMTSEPVIGALVRIQQRVDGDTSLGGSQSTDSHGIVRFTSVYPDRLAHGAACLKLNVFIPGDEAGAQAHHEAWPAPCTSQAAAAVKVPPRTPCGWCCSRSPARILKTVLSPARPSASTPSPCRRSLAWKATKKTPERRSSAVGPAPEPAAPSRQPWWSAPG